MNQLSSLRKAIVMPFLCFALISHANVISVTSFADSGPGTLRQAITDFNAAPVATFSAPDVIDLSAIDGHTISLASNLPEIKNFVKITALNSVVISGNNLYRAFFTTRVITVWFTNLTITKAQNAFTNTGSTIILSNCTITSCSPSSGILDGGGVYNNGKATLNRCLVSNCSAPGGSGGGIINLKLGTLTLDSASWVKGCKADTGAGISNLGKLFLKNGSNIKSNTAVIAGGGIFTNSAFATSVTIDSCTIYGNEAQNGGGIYAQQKLTINNKTVISKNQASINGGGLFAAKGSNVTFGTNFLVISSNIANGNGGGVFLDRSSNTKSFTNVTFISNSSQNGNGGGLFVSETEQAITGCTFKTNTAQLNGGGIYTSAKITLSSVLFYANTCNIQNGGAMYINNNDVIVQPGCAFTGNKAAGGKGGAIYNGTGLLTLTSCAFTTNSAVDGGVIYSIAAPAKPVTLKKCTLTKNSSTGFGCLSTQNGLLQVDSSILLENEKLVATYKPAGKFSQNISGQYSITNTTIQKNDSFLVNQGGAVNLTISKCSLSRNTNGFILGGGNYNFSNTTFDNNDRIMMNNTSVDCILALKNCLFQNYKRGVLYSLSGTRVPNLNADSCTFFNDADTVLTSQGVANQSNRGVIILQQANGTFNHCLFNSNKSPAVTGAGGAMISYGGNPIGITVLNSTFAYNKATNEGGAIQTYSTAILGFTNCTFSHNTAASRGGAINATTTAIGSQGKAKINIASCTMVLNAVTASSGNLGGGIYTDSCNFDISNTIIVGNHHGLATLDDIVTSRKIQSTYGKNLFTSISGPILTGAYTTVASAVAVVDTVIRNNGGFTPTHLLSLGSPAKDFCVAGVPNTDQRGVTRDASPDCGSVEDNASPLRAPETQSSLQKTTTFAGKVMLYPNPTTSAVNVNISVAEAGEYSFTMRTMMGQVLELRKVHMEAGTSRVSFNCGKLAAGSYLMTIENNKGSRQTMTFIKQ